MEEVQPVPEPPRRQERQGLLAAAIIVALAIGADVWLLVRPRPVPPPAEDPAVRATRLLGEARSKSLAGARPDEVLDLLEQAIHASPTLAEARLLRIEVAIPQYLERWAVLDASPLLERARISSDPAVERLRTTMLSDAAALGASPMGEEDRVSVAAIEAFLTDKPIASGTSPRVRVLRGWQLLLEGKARPAMKECDVAEETDPLLRWTFARSLLAVRREEPWRDEMADRAREVLAALSASAAVLLDLAQASPAEAGGLLVRALELSPGELSILSLLAENEERAGNFAQALAWACQATDAAPEAAGLLLLRARLEGRLTQVHAARETYDHARRYFPDRVDVLLARAAFLLRTGGAEKALGDAERAREIAPSEEGFAVLCDALSANGLAEDALRRCVGSGGSIRRARSRALRKLGRYDQAREEAWAVQAWGEVAFAALAQGNPGDAARYVEKPDDPDGWEAAARVHAAWRAHVRTEEAARKALAADPLRAPCHALLGHALLGQKKVMEAREALDKAIEIDPTCVEAWRTIGELCIAQEDPREALKALDKAIEIDRADIQALVLRGESRLRTDDLEGSLADLDQVLGASPENGEWLLLRAEVKLRRSDAAGARADAEKACGVLRVSAAAWSLVARSAFAEGDLDAAEEALEQTFLLDPRDVPALVVSARLALARSQRDKARSELGIALNVDPDDADALHLRAKLAVEDARWQEAADDLERFLRRHATDPRAPEATGWLDLARKGLRER